MEKVRNEDEKNEATDRGDAILKRMLKSKPKLHKEIKKAKDKASPSQKESK